eukprot:2970914-Amphidinium_carterae.1
MLRGLGPWISWAHQCPAITLPFTATRLCGEADGQGLGKLADAWHLRHLGLKAAAPRKTRGLVRSECFQHGTCLCRQKQRAVWQQAATALKAQCKDSSKQCGLLNGDLLILWLGSPQVFDIQDATTWEETTITATYIPLHYSKPWRPTFLEVQPPGNCLNDLHAGAAAEGDNVIPSTREFATKPEPPPPPNNQ